MEEVKNFITKAQEIQQAKGKEGQTRKYHVLQVEAYKTQWAFEPSDHKQEDTQTVTCLKT